MEQRTHRWIILLWCVVLGLVWIPWAAQADVQQLPFEHRSGYLISGPFLDFFVRNGGVGSFGEPRTDAFIEPGGLTVQYFDYARFEWHDHVVLSDLGRQVAVGHTNTAAFAWLAPDTPIPDGRVLVPESGHTLGGAFGWFWQTHGQVAMLGYPISEELEEPQPDGTRVLTQYFERAVLTYHPEHAGTGEEVRREALGMHFAPERPTTLPPVVLAESRLPVVRGTGDEQNIAVAIERLHGQTLAPGAKLSLLAVAGPITRAHGYVEGSGIVGGTIVNGVIGGGICTVSTLLYRVAWQAGLPVEERQGHSLWLQTYADQPGLDAVVDDPSRDLVFRNDTSSPLFIEALVSSGGAEVRLWGVPDGRAVKLERPVVRSNVVAASVSGAPAPDTGPGETGATVINMRRISPQGKAAWVERVVTIYAPKPVSEESPTATAEVGPSQPR